MKYSFCYTSGLKALSEQEHSQLHEVMKELHRGYTLPSRSFKWVCRLMSEKGNVSAADGTDIFTVQCFLISSESIWHWLLVNSKWMLSDLGWQFLCLWHDLARTPGGNLKGCHVALIPGGVCMQWRCISTLKLTEFNEKQRGDKHLLRCFTEYMHTFVR